MWLQWTWFWYEWSLVWCQIQLGHECEWQIVCNVCLLSSYWNCMLTLMGYIFYRGHTYRMTFVVTFFTRGHFEGLLCLPEHRFITFLTKSLVVRILSGTHLLWFGSSDNTYEPLHTVFIAIILECKFLSHSQKGLDILDPPQLYMILAEYHNADR